MPTAAIACAPSAMAGAARMHVVGCISGASLDNCIATRLAFGEIERGIIHLLAAAVGIVEGRLRDPRREQRKPGGDERAEGEDEDDAGDDDADDLARAGLRHRLEGVTADLDSVDVVVTDAGISDLDRTALVALDIEVVVA